MTDPDAAEQILRVVTETLVGSDRVSLEGRTVLIAGASSASGIAVATTLSDLGARVVAVGRSLERLAELKQRVPSARLFACDLSSSEAVAGLVESVHAEAGPIDGLINLVGGWRSGGGIPGQSDEDWAFLEQSLTALRLTSRAFYDDLVASPAGRLAIVSSGAAERPSAGMASYATLKAAAEAWTRAVAQGFAKAGDTAAATILVVKAALAGGEDELALRFAGLWEQPAAAVNGARILLD